MDTIDELLALGQQVLDELVAKYVPTGDEHHALVLFPGQAVPDGLVQDGEMNPLQVSEWLGALYDFPLELELGDSTSLVSTLQTSPTLRSAYATAACWGVPAVPVDDPSRPRLEHLISDARKAVGNGSDTALGFVACPDDFALPQVVWNPFGTTITTHDEQTSQQPGTGQPGTGDLAPPRRVDPNLWRLRAVPEDVVDVLPSRVLANGERVVASRRWQLAGHVDQVDQVERTDQVDRPDPRELRRYLRQQLSAVRLDTLAAQPSGLALGTSSLVRSATVLHDQLADVDRAILVEPVVAADPAPAGGTGPRLVRALDPGLVKDLVAVRLPDLVDAPSTTTVTTADSQLEVHLEHFQVTIERKVGDTTWWHDDLLDESRWCIPGMAAGELVGPSDQPGTATCRPLSLILVRNLSMTGTWTSTASELMAGVHYVGPFLMQVGASSSGSADQQTVVLGQGMQVIGMVCGPLPSIPPSSDPGLEPPTDEVPAPVTG